MTEAVPEFLPPPFLFKKEAFVISEDRPWANDCLGRKEQAEKLDKILETVPQPIVMTLSAPYGMGKSTFIKCWKQSLQNKGVASVVFNAWETDFSQDAFAAFVASIQSQLSSESKSKTKFLDAAKKVGGAMLKNAPAFAAKVVAKAAIGERGIEALENFELKEEDAVKLAEGIASDTFKSQVATQNAVLEFRSTFEKIIADELDGRIIVFIDELDRCRPNYSVEVLERIKHIFAVKGAVFILAVDKGQLLSSISGVYGTKMDASRYLRKFIDWEYRLPQPNHYQYIYHLYYNIFEFDKQKMFIKGESIQNGDVTYFQILTLLSYVFEVSLRDLGQYFTYLNLVWQTKTQNFNPLEISLAAFFKCLVKSRYDDYINWRGGAQFQNTVMQELIEKILLNKEKWLKNNRNSDVLIGWMIIIFSHQHEDENERQVCVDEGFMAKTFSNDTRLNNGWLVKCLSCGYIDRNLPNIRNGLRFLDEMNL
jgi:hypothetical protein